MQNDKYVALKRWAGHSHAIPMSLRASPWRLTTAAARSDQLLRNASRGLFHLEIDLEQLKNDREALHDAVTKRPAEYLGMMELGARSVLTTSRADLRVNGAVVTDADIPPVQITLIGQLPLTPIRSITVRPR